MTMRTASDIRVSGLRPVMQIGVLVMLAFTAVTCAPSTPAEPTERAQKPLPTCGGRNVISVNTSGPVQISWTPACVAAGLGISTADHQTNMWAIGTTDGRATLSGPVQYGLAPSGTVENTPARQLESGARYWILVSGPALSGPGLSEVAPLLMMTSFTMP